MLSKLSQDYIRQQLELCRQSEFELAAEMALSRATGAIDVAHIQGQISASEFLAHHACISKAREERFAVMRSHTEVHKV